jgi:hypothetical protein
MAGQQPIQPTQAPVSFDAPLKQATSVPVPSGVTFDQQPLTAPMNVPGGTTPPVNQLPQPPQPAPQAQPQFELRATPPPSGIADRIERWAQNVSDDLRYGTGNTEIGRLMRGAGAPGLDYGVSPAVADVMGSIPLGVLKAVKGGAELVSCLT